MGTGMSFLKSQTSTRPANQPVHASLFNLISYLPHTQPSFVRKIIENTVEKIPFRGIRISVEEDTSTPLTLETSTRILDKGHFSIVCEHISIHASAGELPKIPFMLMPYLIPDLPIYLLWDQNPLNDRVILPSLHRFATRLIFKADDFGDWQSFGHKMLEYLDTCRIEVMDINWALMGTWRDAFVRLFYSSQAIEQLRYSKQLTITYSGDNSHSDATQSIYLCSWLAAQLGWSSVYLRQTELGFQAHYNHACGGIDVALKSAPECAPTCSPDAFYEKGTLLAIAITTGNDVHYELKRHPLGRQATVHISCSDSCELPFALPISTLWRNLTYMRELFHYRSGTHYRNMLRQLSSTEQQ
jgi:hypothetical protein